MKIAFQLWLVFLVLHAVVMTSMFTPGWEQVEVLNAVVVFDFVDVMNHLSNFDESSKVFFCYENMFLHVSTLVCSWMAFLLNQYVPVGQGFTSFPCMVFISSTVWARFSFYILIAALIAAKVIPCDSYLTLWDVQRLSTEGAKGAGFLGFLFLLSRRPITFLRTVLSSTPFESLVSGDKTFTTDRTMSFSVFEIPSLIRHTTINATKLIRFSRSLWNKFFATLLADFLFFGDAFHYNLHNSIYHRGTV